MNLTIPSPDGGAVRLEAARWGEAGGGPTFVLLHEGLGSVGLWREFPARLAEATGRPVFAWSRAGYGASDPVPLPRPLDYMQREAAAFVAPVLDAAGIGRSVLIGHSDGASIAALYAGRADDPRVERIVLMAPHFFVEDRTVAAIAVARDAYQTGGLRDRLARHHADVDVAFRGWCDAWLDPAFHAWTIADALPRIAVPTLLAQSESDPYGTLAQIAAAERALGPLAARLIVPGDSHAPHLAHPERVIATIAAFSSAGSPPP